VEPTQQKGISRLTFITIRILEAVVLFVPLLLITWNLSTTIIVIFLVLCFEPASLVLRLINAGYKPNLWWPGGVAVTILSAVVLIYVSPESAPVAEPTFFSALMEWVNILVWFSAAMVISIVFTGAPFFNVYIAFVPPFPAPPRAKRPEDRTRDEKFIIWFNQNRVWALGLLSVVVLASVIGAVEIKPLRFEEDDAYENIAFVAVDVQEAEDAPEVAAEGEIEPTEKILEEKEDDRVASAQNVHAIGATPPVDLAPSDKPDYTVEARQAGWQGVVVATVVISEEGRVLQVLVPNHQDPGYGIAQAIVRKYRGKRFRPAILDGKPITVKMQIPVRFTLN